MPKFRFTNLKNNKKKLLAFCINSAAGEQLFVSNFFLYFFCSTKLTQQKKEEISIITVER